MHYYACPYCKTTKLIFVKAKETQCDHKKGFLFNKDKECKEDNYKCKEVLECKKCDSYFRITKDFLKTQKRKIKDG